MFSNLGYEDKEAFFSLLDEYFASRPHLLAGASASASRSPQSPNSYHAPSPTAGSSSGRTLPPVNRSPAPPLASPGVTSPGGYSPGGFGGVGSNEKPDMATRLVSSGLKLGTAGARTGLNMLSKNQKAMDAIGRAGANAMVAQAQSRLGGPPPPPNQGQNQGQVEQEYGQGQGQAQNVPPPVAAKKSGLGGLSSKSFGMFKGSSNEPEASPVSPGPSPARTTAQPPVRQSSTSVSSAGGQAQALYDYTGADSGDLSVQANQVVNVIERTSDDWWTCEDGHGQRGLVPSSYLREM